MMTRKDDLVVGSGDDLRQLVDAAQLEGELEDVGQVELPRQWINNLQ